MKTTMKNIILTFVMALGMVLFLTMCEKNDQEPKFNLDGSTEAAFTSPASGTTYTLSMADSAIEFTVKWSPAEYIISGDASLPKPTYSLQMAFAGTDFSGATELVNTTDNIYETIYYKLNNALLKMGMTADSTDQIDFRIVSLVDGVSASELVSGTIQLTMTTFQPPAPPVEDLKLIYLLGSGSTVGWSNTDALPMTLLDSTGAKYGIVDHLTPGADQYIKFISILGNWAPQWGTDATGEPESGPLVYRPTEDIADPAAIPVGADEGNYYIVADTVALTYETILTSGELYLVGGATDVGWTPENAIPFEQDPDTLTKFTLVAHLTVGNGGMKFLEVPGQWAPQWGMLATDPAQQGPTLSYRPTEAVADPPEIPAPATEGDYLITVNLQKMRYWLKAQ